MAGPSSRRSVRLIDAHSPGRPFVEAELYRDFPAIELANIESLWRNARESAASNGITGGLTAFEHAHWDWRNKTDSVEQGQHMLVAIECRSDVQGIMALLRSSRHSLFTDNSVVYVDYLESAPWNLKSSSISPRFIGVGTVLIAEAVRLSLESGLNGRIGLHSLPQSEGFYETKCRMTRFSQDPTYFNLTYFEFSDHNANDWLTSIGDLA